MNFSLKFFTLQIFLKVWRNLNNLLKIFHNIIGKTSFQDASTSPWNHFLTDEFRVLSKKVSNVSEKFLKVFQQFKHFYLCVYFKFRSHCNSVHFKHQQCVIWTLRCVNYAGNWKSLKSSFPPHNVFSQSLLHDTASRPRNFNENFSFPAGFLSLTTAISSCSSR